MSQSAPGNGPAEPRSSPIATAVSEPLNGAGSATAVTSAATAGSATPAAPGPADRRPGPGEAPGLSAGPVCTAPQLRRFIKSRPYVPMHELRRRFGINGSEDDVTGISLGTSLIFVGLPGREGLLLGELLRGGEVGYELSLDPRTPIVIGLYPMRPVARS